MMRMVPIKKNRFIAISSLQTFSKIRRRPKSGNPGCSKTCPTRGRIQFLSKSTWVSILNDGYDPDIGEMTVCLPWPPPREAYCQCGVPDKSDNRLIRMWTGTIPYRIEGDIARE